jgi:hypothetical protein
VKIILIAVALFGITVRGRMRGPVIRRDPAVWKIRHADYDWSLND